MRMKWRGKEKDEVGSWKRMKRGTVGGSRGMEEEQEGGRRIINWGNEDEKGRSRRKTQMR